MNILLIIILIISLAYIFIILQLTIGWNKLEEYQKSNKLPETKASIIIAVRNEEDNIENCLGDLIRQDYPPGLFEIIIVDDDSTDNTVELTKKIIQNNLQINFSLLSNKTLGGKYGKKASIANAIKQSSGKLIITTDADCRMGEKYISIITDYYECKHPKMILAPLCFKNEYNFFQKLQSIEFLSLIASSAGAIKTIGPLMCNGANLAYEKEAFINTEGFNNNMNYASGDDMFLMFNIHKKYPGSVHFLKNKDAIVYTEAKETLKDFIEQRKRWVSKTKGYKNLRVILIAVVIYLYNFSIVGTFIGGIFNFKLLLISFVMLLVKLLSDHSILNSISRFVNKSKLMKYYFPLQFIYVIYITAIAILGIFTAYKWKDRTIKN